MALDSARYIGSRKHNNLELRRDRFFRLFTSPLRVLPDFLIIGAQKGGTTSLYRYLSACSTVMPALTKEVHFFDWNYEKGVNWYRANFPMLLIKDFLTLQRGHALVTGESSPNYLFHPKAPVRIARLLPRVKLIAVLRNPVDRALSSYYHQVREGFETRSFEDAIAAEAQRLEGDTSKILAEADYLSPEFRQFAYLAKGIYVHQVKRWYERFSRDQILILKSEDLFGQPADTVNQIMAFLKVSSQPAAKFKRFNAGSYEPMDAATRRRLTDYFVPYNQQLFELLGIDFGWHD